jgi:hypothetical protein
VPVAPRESKLIHSNFFSQLTTILAAFRSLSLIIAACGAKPALAMKTISGKFRFVVLGVIVIVAAVSCCYFPSTPDTRISLYSVVIGGTQRAPTAYVEWKDKGRFDNALDQLRANGEYCLCAVVNPGDHPHYPYRPYKPNHCPSDYNCPSATIRTVKVTKSKAADRIAAGESVANDPNITWRVASSDPALIKNVLDELKP